MDRKSVTGKILGGLAIGAVVIGGIFLMRQFKSDGENSVTVTALKTEYRVNPIGMDEAIPRFSWEIEAVDKTIEKWGGLSQGAYEIYVAASREDLEAGNYIWDSGRTESPLSVGVEYAGPALQPRTRYWWSVSIWPSQQSDLAVRPDGSAFYETGLMDSDWDGAAWIGAPRKVKLENDPTDTTDYTVSVDMKVLGNSSALCFAYDEADWSYYNWYVKTDAEGNILLQTRNIRKYMTEWEETVNITDLCAQMEPAITAENLPDTMITLSVDVRGDHATTKINGVTVCEQTIAPRALGQVGFMLDRADFAGDAYFDNLVVTGGDGREIVREDFEGKKTVFGQQELRVEDGLLHMGFGRLLIPDETTETAAPMLQKNFAVQKNIASARLYVTALGIYECEINGARVGENYLSPGNVVYGQTLPYQTYDVTDLLQQGDNAIGAILGHGWYDRATGYFGAGNPWGHDLGLLADLVITYQDGTSDSIHTGADWKYYGDGPVRRNDIYTGETYDATKEVTGFGTPAVDPAGWDQAAVLDADTLNKSNRIGNGMPQVHNEQILHPVSVTEPVRGTFVYDFGQNFSGICRIKVNGKPGQRITLRHGEHLNTAQMSNRDGEVGTVWTKNLGSAVNTDIYVCKGEGEESFAPTLVYRGFRYVEITGVEEGLLPEDVEGLVLTSEMEPTGSFTCGVEAVNRLYENQLWGQKSNYVSVPTDCPQRDERHGWTGDAQMFAETAGYNSNTYAFMNNYLGNLRDVQAEDGSYPDMAPRNFYTDLSGKGGIGGNAGWGDAGVIIPWRLYQQYGDIRAIRENLDAMCAWVDYLADNSENGLRDNSAYGDHLSAEDTPKAVTDTAWAAYSSLLVSRMAAIAGDTEKMNHCAALYDQFRMAWNQAFVTEGAHTVCNTQTSYVVGLAFELFAPEDRAQAAQNLADLVAAEGNHIATGYVGMGYINEVLSDTGHSDTAYALLLQSEYPSWLYEIQNDATTPWESWSGIIWEGEHYRVDGSLNHAAPGSIGAWLYRNVLGIRPDPLGGGYQHFVIAPSVNDEIGFASGDYHSMYGRIHSEWKIEGDTVRYTVTIPPNTTATVRTGAGEQELQPGTHSWTEPKD